MQVQTNIGLTFVDGIRTLMRQDPDIIMVGEIRDIETADMAIQAALTGNLGYPPCIQTMRLVRTLCPACKAPHEITDAEWASITLPFKAAKPNSAMKAVGCIDCRNTGYRGRSGIYEMLTITPKLRKLIKPETDLSLLKNMAYQDGMQPLMLNGAEKVTAGMTTVEELLKVAPPLDQ